MCSYLWDTTLGDNDGDAKRYLQSGEHFQAGVGQLKSGMVAVRTVSAEHIHLISLLQPPQVFCMGLQRLPEGLDVPGQRLRFRERRIEMPGVIPPGRRSPALSFALAMDVRWFDSKLPGDFF